MRVFRLVQAVYEDTAFEGLSTRKPSGRWNYRQAALYTSPQLSLASLEILVNRGSTDILDYVAFELEVDEADILVIGADDLPSDWNVSPWPSSTQEIGNEWLKGLQSVGLMVPSTVVPEESNVLLNPLHPKMDEIIKTAAKVNYSFDPRLK